MKVSNQMLAASVDVLNIHCMELRSKIDGLRNALLLLASVDPNLDRGVRDIMAKSLNRGSLMLELQKEALLVADSLEILERVQASLHSDVQCLLEGLNHRHEGS